MKNILITGGCGFIGHHVVEHLIKNTDWNVFILDKLNYASTGFDRLRDISVFDDSRIHLFSTDLVNPLSDGVIKELKKMNYIVHMAAETHVNNSIKNPDLFVKANVLGTLNILQYARKIDAEKFIYFSTDEVFGPAPVGTSYKEWDRYNSTNPYSASKAGGEELCLAFANTFKVPIIITHTMNVFGERQHPEKFIPMVIRRVLIGDKILIHSDPTKTISGSRFWIHARNVASAILFLLEKGKIRDKYNVVGEREVSNLDMAQKIAKCLGKKLVYEMVDFHSSRPGHDLRYALDGTKMREMGWNIPISFEKSLESTIQWSVKHPGWLK